ncbi:MAG: HAMP domain-containing protein [Candidatus Obscuribacterales bacterium]|nr:HAMP domain-containing protein [Steroidobacteraceae bacterium]
MRERLKQLWSVLLLDFRKVKLSWLLAGINVAVVLLVVAGISFSAIRLLRNLADSQGVVRVQYAGATAREELRKQSEDVLTVTRGVATRPTLRRMVDEESANAITPFLRRACQTAGADICVVAQGDKLIAQSGISQPATTPASASAELPWKEIFTASSEQGERFMLAPMNSPLPMLGAATAIGDSATGQQNLKLYVLRFLDEKMAARLSERTGLNVRLVNYRAFASMPVNALTQLHSSALSDGRSAAVRIDDVDIFASSFPIFAATGEAIALIETRLSTEELDASVQALVRRLLITALVLGALAVIAALLLGRQVADPVRALTEAATRLGQGDFATSIPVDGAAEVGVLARTMEDMRRNLVELTGHLRRREAEAQAVLNGVIEGVYAVDKNRNITYLNSQAARLFGVAPETAIGRFCGDVLKPCAINGERPCERRCPIVQARDASGAQATEQIEPVEGQRRATIITSAAPIEGLQVQVIRDETQLEAARRARDSVLANISHEFRTPLAAQLASIELLRDGLDTMTAEARRELVTSLERGTQRLTRLIDNLLESVRIEAGQLSIRRQSLSLPEVIEDAHALVASLLTARKQQLELNLPDDLQWLQGDGPRLTQVFVNLLANASKFSPEASTLRVGAENEDSRVIAWVEDEGEGVPEITSGSIFDRFSRGPGEEPEPGGLGLGLWIVKSIVERHGGAVTATRTQEGRTRFIVSLPTGSDA